jgi:hypothetical protein
MDDASLSNALLGLEPGIRTAPPTSRVLRMTLLLCVVMGILLLGLYGLYGALGDRAKEADKKRMGAAALERIVVTRMTEVSLDRLLAKFEEDAGAPIDFILPSGEDVRTPLVSLDLDDGIRLESALLLLSEFHGLTFLVGEDRVVVPAKGEPAATTGDAGLTARLDTETATLSYQGSDLPGALRHLGNVKGVNLIVDPKSARKVARTPARLDVSDVPLRKILDALLTPAGLTFEVRHEVVLVR